MGLGGFPPAVLAALQRLGEWGDRGDGRMTSPCPIGLGLLLPLPSVLFPTNLLPSQLVVMVISASVVLDTRSHQAACQQWL